MVMVMVMVMVNIGRVLVIVLDVVVSMTVGVPSDDGWLVNVEVVPVVMLVGVLMFQHPMDVDGGARDRLLRGR